MSGSDSREARIIASNIVSAARNLLRHMKQTPGGDAYEYTGAMNDVEWLQELLHEWDMKVVFPRRD